MGRTRGPGRSHGSGPVNGQAQNTVTQHAIAIPSHHRVHAELFAAGRDDPRGRRPSDAIRAVAYLVVLLVVAVLSVIGHDFDTRFSNALVDLPGFLHALWWIGVWGAVAWATALLVIMLVRGRPCARFITAQLLGGLLLGATLASGAVAAVALGLLAGTTLHLVFGSPGGFPTVGRVRSALEDLGVDVDGLHPVSMGREGSVLLAGRDAVGPVQVKMYGRDAWDGELVASAWRRVWYRGTQRTRGSAASSMSNTRDSSRSSQNDPAPGCRTSSPPGSVTTATR